VAGFDLTNFFGRYIDGLEELPFNEYLAGFGLTLASNADEGNEGNALPWLGITLKGNQVKFVEAGSPAERSGMNVGDELVALDHRRFGAEAITDRLAEYVAGDRLTLTFFHQEVLQQATVILGEPRATQFFIVPMPAPTEQQLQNFAGWLGIPLAEVV
jgi:predicted metalloprotease with PDZ domain